MSVQPKFVDQTGRIAFLWLSAPLVLVMLIFTQTAWRDDFIGAELIEHAGLLLVFACIAGRCWAALHIGSRKNAELVTSGPYAMTRNPLYFFSCLGLAGGGMLLESLALGVLLFGFGYLVFLPVMRREAAHLRQLFGKDHDRYSRRVPQFFPAIGRADLAPPPAELTYAPKALRRTFIDACYFLLIFPAAGLVQWIQEQAFITPLLSLY